MDMELDKIRELVELVERSQIQELELSNRGETIRISKVPAVTVAPAAYAPAVAAPAPVPAALAGQANGGGTSAAPAPPALGENIRDVSSPMVGTFYRAPAPDAEPFVRVGDRVEKGDVVCIIEAMKVLNEIETEVAGVVREILVENAQPVEYGQPLFLIEAS
jgi:acetyl-CoA carboxylase biotin carboxyl carrier protein